MPHGHHLDRDRIKNDLTYKVRQYHTRHGDVAVNATIVVHSGPKAWKEVSLLTILDMETGEIRRRELRAQTWNAVLPKGEDRYDFTENESHWRCENAEIEALRIFLNNEFPDVGTYHLIRKADDFGNLVAQLADGTVEPANISRLLQLAGRAPELVSSLAASKDGALLAEAVELQKRRDQLHKLQEIVEGESTNERDHIHPQLKEMGWIFGGQYVGEAKRRQLTTGDVLDIPLLRPDGSLQIVELKCANIPKLIQRYRGAVEPQEINGQKEELPLIVGKEVNEAVGQAMNYLCHLDEERDHILARFKIETRRASAIVLIGHPKFVTLFNDEEIADTLRIYNSHHSRIQVMHYQQLINNATRALALAEVPISDEVDDSDTRKITESCHEPDSWDDNDLDYYSDSPPF